MRKRSNRITMPLVPQGQPVVVETKEAGWIGFWCRALIAGIHVGVLSIYAPWDIARPPRR